MTTLSAYLQTWKLKVSHTKTVTAAFYLNNQEAKRELNNYNNLRLLAFCPNQLFCDKTGQITHVPSLSCGMEQKLYSRVRLLRRLVGSGWVAGAKTLHKAVLSLVYSTDQYCAQVWCRGAHTRLIDSVPNDASHVVTGCLRPTPMDHLPILSGIQPAELRRLGATLFLANGATLDPDHMLNS